MKDQVLIGHNRKITGAATLLFGIAAIVGLSRSLTEGNVVGVIIAMAVFGLPTILFARWTLRRGPVLVIDADGLTDRRFGFEHKFRWQDVNIIRIESKQETFGNVSHQLVAIIRKPSESHRDDTVYSDHEDDGKAVITVPLNRLSLGWEEIVTLVEARLGRRVIMKKQTGLFQRSESG